MLRKIQNQTLYLNGFIVYIEVRVKAASVVTCLKNQRNKIFAAIHVDIVNQRVAATATTLQRSMKTWAIIESGAK